MPYARVTVVIGMLGGKSAKSLRLALLRLQLVSVVGVLISIGSFQVVVAPTVLNVPPESTLVSPLDSSETSALTPTLVWNSSDDNADELVFRVFIHETKNLVESLDGLALVDDSFSHHSILSPGRYQSQFLAPPLKDNVVYYWTVIPRDTNNATGNCTSGVWSFSTNSSTVRVGPTSDFKTADEELFEGEIVEFDGSPSTSPDSNITSWLWNFGDGEREQGGMETHHVYRDNGSYWVTLTVADSDAQIKSYQVLISVSNVPPVVEACCDREVEVGDEVEMWVISFHDSSPIDLVNLEYFWDFDDGSSESGMSSFHSYDERGEYIVTLNVSDGDGGFGTDTIIIAVNDRDFWETPWFTFGFPIVVALIFLLLPSPIKGFIRRRRERKERKQEEKRMEMEEPVKEPEPAAKDVEMGKNEESEIGGGGNKIQGQ